VVLGEQTVKRPSLDWAVTAALVVCALTTTAVVVRHEFFAAPRAPQRDQKPLFIKGWRDYLATGMRIGSSEAPVQVMEFADFECPFCAAFHKEESSLRERYATQVAVTFVHYPLPMHRFAVPAARAAECAGDQAHFGEMSEQLFKQQDQFGLKPWTEFATDAGVPDLVAYKLCLDSSAPLPRVTEGLELGKKLDVQGTPTIIINGWKLGHPPTEAELDQMIQRILAGKSPVDGKS
jgi:protein-disulfide isomerase